MKKLEFSKKIFIAMFTMSITFTTIAALITFSGGDISSFSNIVLAMWASVATGELAYYSKAKAENLIKIAQNTSIADLEKANTVRNLTD